jgi:hypothetical protein
MSGSVTKTIDLPASAEDVWAIVGDFNGLPNWNAGVLRSELSNDRKRRTLHLKVGGTVVEDLLEHDHAARRMSYSIIESAVPVSSHKATLTVKERGPGQSMVHWTCEFEPKGAPLETVEGIFSRIFEGGLKQLAEVVAARR